MLVVVDAPVLGDGEARADPPRGMLEAACAAVELPDDGAVTKGRVGRGDEIPGPHGPEAELAPGAEPDHALLPKPPVGREHHVRLQPSAFGKLLLAPPAALLGQPVETAAQAFCVSDRLHVFTFVHGQCRSRPGNP